MALTRARVRPERREILRPACVALVSAPRTRFTGFPDEDNPYAKLAPHDDPEPLLVLVEVTPRLDAR